MLFVFLLIFFVVLSGKLTWEIALVGALVCALADLLACRALGWSVQKSKKLLRLLPDILSYIAMLFIEIIKANIAVIRIILSPDMKELNPVLFTYNSRLKTEIARTVLADSITITPGTITVNTDSDKLTVHSLGDGFVFGDEMYLAERLRKIEKKESEHNA